MLENSYNNENITELENKIHDNERKMTDQKGAIKDLWKVHWQQKEFIKEAQNKGMNSE